MSSLFEPLSIRGLTFRNRIFLAPMCQYSCDRRDGIPTDWHLVHLGSFAIGGFALILSEATAVSPEGRISPEDSGLWNDDQISPWRRITDFVHAQGAIPGVQLAHAGRKASRYRPFLTPARGSVPFENGGWQTLGPSAVAYQGYKTPREMTVKEITDVVVAFGAAAARADQAGFDVIELHAAHGYLIHEFLSPLSNFREDEFGGNFAGRSRLLRDVVSAIRSAWPAHKALFVRFSATDWAPGGWTLSDTTRAAELVKDLGADLVDASSGSLVAHQQIPVGPGYQVPLAAEIRRGADILTGAVGLITTPAQAEKVLADGAADVVFLGRAALREPGWPLRAARELQVAASEAPYRPQYERGAWA